MLFHVSIDADNPKRIAQVIAELWGGPAMPFPAVIPGSWIAMAGDARNTLIEVYPRGTELTRAEGEGDAYGVLGTNSRKSATHFAMATPMGIEPVIAIAKREGWPIKYCKRGGAFGVLELWMEGTRMIEVLTPEMQQEYLQTMTVEGWTGFLRSVGMAEAA